MQKSKGKRPAGQTSGTREPPSLYTLMMPSGLHPNLVFNHEGYGPNIDRYNQYNEVLTKLLQQTCEYPRRIDWTPLDQVGLTPQILKSITQTIRYEGYLYEVNDIEKLIKIQEPIYLELCQEFFATVEQHKVKLIDEIFLTFRLGGRYRELSMRELAACLGIYTDEEMTEPWFVRYIMEGDRLDEGTVSAEEWARVSDHRYKAGSNPTSAIKSVKDKVIQRLLAHTIANRGKNTEKVTKADLWYLIRIKDKVRINLVYCMGKYLTVYAAGPKTSSKICGGQFITRIANWFRIDLSPRDHPFTLVRDPDHVIGVEMFRAAGAVRVKKGKIIPWDSTEAGGSSTVDTRAGSRGRRLHDSDSDDEEGDDADEAAQDAAPGDEDQEMEDIQTEEPTQSQAGGSGFLGQPDWSTFMSRFDRLELNQQTYLEESRRQWALEQNHRDRSEYEWGVINYKQDWIVHNTERMYDHIPNMTQTPYHQPPLWGQPGGVNPPPTYDRDAAFIELQKRDEQRQAGWDRTWEEAEAGRQHVGQEYASGSWFCEDYNPHPSYDASKDY